MADDDVRCFLDCVARVLVAHVVLRLLAHERAREFPHRLMVHVHDGASRRRAREADDDGNARDLEVVTARDFR